MLKNYRLLHRIWVESIESDIVLNLRQKVYLIDVLRLKNNDFVRVFNDVQGEYVFKLSNNVLHKEKFIKDPKISSSLFIAPCLIKPKNFILLLSMATQLGVTEIQPLIGERSQVHMINYERCNKCLIEAVEQSERFCIPKLLSPIKINELLIKYNKSFIYANEHESNKLILDILNLKIDFNNTILIVGPEGGLSNKELELLSATSNSYSINLGTNILRAETALIVILSQFMLIKNLKTYGFVH